MGKKSEITGGGAVPPADAPVETAQPIQADALAHMQERARQNEKTLPPFNPKPMGGQGGAPSASHAAAAAASPSASSTGSDPALIADFFGSDAPVAAVEAPRVQPTAAIPPMNLADQALVDQVEDMLPPLTDEDRQRMPAASNTDSPTRGRLPDLTPPTGDKYEGISRGGFSDLADAQYFPLDGSELKELVRALMDDLNARIENDLRFSLALWYPRVRAVVEIRIEGHADDADMGFTIPKIKAPKDGEKGGTPMEIARLKADEVCFVVQSFRQEFTPDGESDRPPDAIRDELRLPKPRKQILDTNGQQVFVDVAMGSDVGALTR